MKFLRDLPFFGPGLSRWDVVVFHYPEEPETNYIKRLVGLPGEDLRVYFGDILTRKGPDEPFRIERKPLNHQQSMQMIVWDDTKRPRALADRPEWRRWAARDWAEGPDGTYTLKAPADGWADLRYRHLVPEPDQWEAILRDQQPPRPPRRTLITDFYAYNTGVTGDGRRDAPDWFQPHWVGDLTLSCRLESRSASGRVRLELVEGGVAHRCEIDLATGMATLYRGDKALGEPAATAVKGAGSHDLVFANVDDRLTLWVDGRTPFGDGLAYDDGTGVHPAPTAADLDPAGVSARGAAVAVSGLVLKRDIYYTQKPGGWDYAGLGINWPPSPFDLLADPARFPELGRLEHQDFTVSPGHYMMLGDNSPRSKDSRGWSRNDRFGYYDHDHDRRVEGWDTTDRDAHEVPESLIIGKAFFVYWPHGKPLWPDIRITRDFRFPFRPYFERMKLIR
jgi:hypothetical protein